MIHFRKPKVHAPLSSSSSVLQSEKKTIQKNLRTAVQQCSFTWPKALGVADSNQAGVVHFGLREEQRQDAFVLAKKFCWNRCLVAFLGRYLTDREASLSSLYLAAMPKRVLLLPAVQARVMAVSSSSFTFW